MPSKNQGSKDFNKNHKFLGKVIEKSGKQIFLWSCSCGASKELPYNSGIYIGARVESEKHYEEVMRERREDSLNGSESISNQKSEESFQEPSKCSAHGCRNDSLGIIEKDQKAPYCLMHISALVRSNRKKPRIIFADSVTNDERLKVLKGEWRDKPIETNYLRSMATEPRWQINSEELASIGANSNSEVPVKEAFFKSNVKPRKSGSLVKGVLVTLILFVMMFWYSDYQGTQDAVERLSDRNSYASKCIRLSEEDKAAKSGPVGSSVRNQEVTKFYTKLIKTECVEWGDGTILKNVFFGVSESSAIFGNLRNAFQYSLRRSNGIEPLTQQCADGWNSPSIGKQGACSSHGGVVSGFLEKNEWRLGNYLGNGEWIYPPLSELIEATKE